METRPKIKRTLSKLDQKLELGSKLFLFLLWALTFYSILKLPPTIPTHFNASGRADDYGNKMTLLILPALGTIIYFGLTQLAKYPHIFNYITKITADNAQKQYTLAARSLSFLKLSVLLVFSLIVLFDYLTTIGITNGLGRWFLPLVLVLLLTPALPGIRQSFLKKE